MMMRLFSFDINETVQYTTNYLDTKEVRHITIDDELLFVEFYLNGLDPSDLLRLVDIPKMYQTTYGRQNNVESQILLGVFEE